MAQRKTYTRSSGTKGRTSSYSRKPSPAGSTRYSPTRNQKRPSGGGGARIFLVVILVAIIAVGAVVIIKNLPTSAANANSDAIIEGITIDGINVAGMSKEEAYTAVNDAAQARLDNISISFSYNNKSWPFTADQLQATIDVQSVIDQAYAVGRTGESAKENRQVIEETKATGLALKTVINVDRTVLADALKDFKDEIDQPMVEAAIEFDPSGYNGPEYMEDKNNPEVDMTRDMFTISEGSVGYVMDYDKALQELNDALTNGWTADIALAVKEEHPKYTAEELRECTTLVYHSSSKNTHRDDTDRNLNLEKALGYFKGMVIMPGEIVSYNDVLGERTLAAGWHEANTITQEKTLEKALGGGICQIATTLYNAAFMANCKIIDRGPHSWPGYREDFGYGMDAMVNWDTDELIFQNDSEYPMFINTYYVPDSYNRIGYVDIDIFTMPQKDEQGNILHIIPECNIVVNEPMGEPEYKEAEEDEFTGEKWSVDTNLGKQTFTYRGAKNHIEVEVFKVWYKDCVQGSLGVWAGGVEVKRERDHYDIYAGVTAIIYTKPTPTPPPATPTPSPEPSPS